MDLYRAEAIRRHRGGASRWKSKWRKDPQRAIEQAKRWQKDEAAEVVEVVCSNGMRVTLVTMLETQASKQFR